MMLLHRYLATTILETTGLVLLALLGMETFILFVNELGDLGVGNYGLIRALEYVILNLPQQLYSLFPMAGLLGVLLGLGLLAGHSELIVMRAAGVSLYQIIWTVTKIVLIVLMMVTAIGETVAPSAGRMADNLKDVAMNGGQALQSMRGTWLRDGNNYIHISHVVQGEHLQGISRYEFDTQHHLLTASYAKEGHYQQSRWMMNDVMQSKITKEHVNSYHLAETSWKLTLNPTMLRNAVLDPDTLSLSQLYQTMVYRKHSGLQEGIYELIFWKRIFQPLATAVMMLLAIPFIFGPLRSVPMGVRMLAGITVGFGFYLVNELFGPMSLVLQWPPILAAMLPVGLFFIAGIMLLRRTR